MKQYNHYTHKISEHYYEVYDKVRDCSYVQTKIQSLQIGHVSVTLREVLYENG